MRERTHRTALHLAFFVSGACGLAYQVTWVRRLGTSFGATTFAMATVLATFMAGLALGSWWAGPRADRLKSPLRGYALLEIGVGLSALATPALLGWVGSLQAQLLAPEAGLPLTIGLQALLAGLVMLVPTTCMGATLPVLSRWASRSVETRGRDLGRLYAANTLGAVAGALIVGFWAIEHLGLGRTNTVAVAGNLGVAAVVAWLARRQESRPADHAVTETPVARKLLLYAALSGLLALGHEVVWTRLVGLVLLHTTYAYTMILSVVIAGIGVGSLWGAELADSRDGPARLFGWVQVAIGVGTVSLILAMGGLISSASPLLDTHLLPFRESQWAALGLCALLLAPPSFLMGACYPLLAKAVTMTDEGVGRRVGEIYAANTVGAIAGSALAGFALLPLLGVQKSLGLLALGNVVLGLWAARPEPVAGSRSRWLWRIWGVLPIALLCLSLSRLDLYALYRSRLPEGSRILHLAEGITSTVMVADHSRPPVRRLWIQSCWVAGTGGSHRMLGHLGMLHGSGAKRAVGIAFGTGQSFGSALLHGLEQMDCVDLDAEVLRAGETFFGDYNHHVLSDPRTRTVIADGRNFLARNREPYDAVLLEPLQPWSAGAVNLYTQEFYQVASDALVEGGSITQWLPLDDSPVSLTRSVIGTFASVFPRTWVYLDNYDLWIVGRKGEEPLSLARWSEALEDPEIREELADIDYGEVESILSTLLLGPADLAAYLGEPELLTDDRPFLEFVAPRAMQGSHMVANLEALAQHCQSPLEGMDGPELEELRDGRVARALARSTAMEVSGQLAGSQAVLAEVWSQGAGIGRLAVRYREATWRLADALVQAGKGEEASQVYQDHLAVDPAFEGGWLNLGLLLAQSGHSRRAREALRKVQDPVLAQSAAQALSMLGALEPGQTEEDGE